MMSAFDELAVAEMGMSTGALNISPLVGLVISTIGGGGSTSMLTGAEVADAPLLSAATAVSE